MLLSVGDERGFGLEEALIVGSIIVVSRVSNKAFLFLGGELFPLLVELLELLILAQLGVREAVGNAVVRSFWQETVYESIPHVVVCETSFRRVTMSFLAHCVDSYEVVTWAQLLVHFPARKSLDELAT